MSEKNYTMKVGEGNGSRWSKVGPQRWFLFFLYVRVQTVKLIIPLEIWLEAIKTEVILMS